MVAERIIFLIIIVLMETVHHFERKDLYSRLMSRNLGEFRRNDAKEKTPESAHKRVLDKWRSRGGGS